MPIPHLDYLKEKGLVWFNPCNGLSMFWDEYRKVASNLKGTPDYVWNHRDLKKAKEIYATSIIAKIFEIKEKVGPWYILKPKQDPPDGVIGTILQKNGLKKMHVKEVEVVEHLSGKVSDTIRKKLSEKAYESNTILVCFVTQGGVYDFEEEAKIISKESLGLDNIFCVFLGAKLNEIKVDGGQDEIIKSFLMVSLVQIKPTFSFLSLSPIDACSDWRAGREKNFFIFDGYGKGDQRDVTLKDPPKLF